MEMDKRWNMHESNWEVYLYLVNRVNDDDDVSLMACWQSFKPAGELLQDLTGLHRQARNGPEVLQQLCENSETDGKHVLRMMACLQYKLMLGGGHWERRPYFDCEAFDNENRLRAGGKWAVDKMIQEQGVWGLLLLLLDPEKD